MEDTAEITEAPDTKADKKTTKKSPRRKHENILSQRTEIVDINALKPYEKNPRVGDVKAIADSLEVNGQFKPIVVNKRTMQILGGNHTWKAALSLGWGKIAVVFVDANEQQSKRIVLADNRTNDLATYQTDVLAEIIASLDSSEGTGYDEETAQALVDSIASADPTEAIADIMRPSSLMATPEQIEQASNFQPPEPDNRVTIPTDLGKPESAAGDVTDYEATNEGVFEKAGEEIDGAFGLKVGKVYEGSGYWGIPALLPSMLVQPDEVPRNLMAWAGSATKDWDDEDQWWLYNFGIDSTSGMKDISKAIMSFFCWDDYFETWWEHPDRMTGKMLNSGIRMAVTPDFSTWADEPRVNSLLAIYKSRYLGRYFQEAGVKVIPHITWPNGDYEFFDNIVRPTLPKKLPVVAVQLQTAPAKMTQEEIDDLIAYLRHVGKAVDPELTIFYVGQQTGRILTETPDLWPGEIMIVRNRMELLSEQAKQRTNKNTI